MKKILLLFVLSLAFSTCFAQPGFTRNDMPGIGDHDTLMVLQYQAITNNLDTETGNGYSWDFSSLPFNVQNFIDVDSFRVVQHPASANFPNATIEEFKTGVTGQTVNLYSYSNDTLIIHRLGSPATGWALGPIASIAFPIAFNNTCSIQSNIYTGTGFSILVGQRTTTTLYDGFGTLHMPNGKTYTNVFRIKQVEKDTNYVTMGVTTATNYIWYKQGGQVPLLRLAYSGALNLYFVFGSKGTGTSTGLNEPQVHEALTIYPNPSSNSIRFETKSEFIGSKYSITTLDGKIVFQGVINEKNTSVDIRRLKSGMYFLSLAGNAYRFIKE